MARTPLSLWETLLLALGLCLVLHTQAAPVDTNATRVEQQGDGQNEEEQPHVATLDEILEHASGGREEEAILEKLRLKQNGVVTEGIDTLLTPEQEAILREHDSNETSKRRLPTFVTLWTNATVPYEWGSLSGNEGNKELMKKAFDEWENHTCVRFVPAEGHHEHRIKFVRDNGCYSYLGMLPNRKEQEISLDYGCHVHKIYLHELGHALGLVHEHQLPQRDNNVTVQMMNVVSGKEHNFRKYTALEIPNAANVPYSYTSIMHYGKYTFSYHPNVLQTLSAVDKSQENVMGTAESLSDSDIETINIMYCMHRR